MATIVAPPTPAQSQFVELGRHHVPTDDALTFRLAAGDVDGDGDADLATISATNDNFFRYELRLHDNVGSGILGPSRVLAPSRNGPLHLVDVDRDRDLDLVASTDAATAGLWINDGRGQFSAVQAFPSVTPTALGFGDVDGDGDLDGVARTYANGWMTVLWLNNGAGLFTDATLGRLPSSVERAVQVILSDVDGDRDLDILLGNSAYQSQFLVPGQSQLFVNDGRGHFVDVTATHLPLDPRGLNSSFAVADVDGDRDGDLVVGGWQATRLYLNDGTGKFADATAGRLPASAELAAGLVLADVDADGDVDLAQASWKAGQLFLNDGSGRFTEAAGRLPGDLAGASLVLHHDLDGGGDQDLVFTTGTGNRLLLNDGRGGFIDATAPPLPRVGRGRGAVLGDFDGDRSLDMLLLRAWDEPGAELYRNDGYGWFTLAAGALSTDPDHWYAPRAIDADGDADLDCFLFAYLPNVPGVRLRLLLNDGRGTLRDSTRKMPAVPPSPQMLEAGDVDSDGDVDLVVAAYLDQNRLLLNDGRGGFVDASSQLPSAIHPTCAASLRDVDGDRDLDLLMGHNDHSRSPPMNRTLLYLNDGRGRFTDATTGRVPADNESTHVVLGADFDGDRDVDFILGGINYSSPPRVRLYENDGAGTFRDVTAARIAGAPTNCIPTVGDIDDDGDPDILTDGGMGKDRLFLNDGFGTFTEAATRAPTGTQGFGHVLGDLDGDGDLDLVRSSWQRNTTQMLANVHRQLHVPHLALLGRPLTLDVYATPGYAAADQLGLLFAAAGAASIPVPPFGVLRLDPTSLVALPAVTIPRATGKGSAATVVPNDPRLRGLRLSVQAGVMPPSRPAAARLTNASLETVR